LRVQAAAVDYGGVGQALAHLRELPQVRRQLNRLPVDHRRGEHGVDVHSGLVGDELQHVCR
jgi:hypothetical protein